jgi:hypothetical protein
MRQSLVPSVSVSSRRNAKARRPFLWIEPLEERTLPTGILVPVSPFSAPLPHSDSAGGASQIKNSDNGRYVVYTSSAPNLIPNQINQSVATNIFLYDTQQRTTTLVSHDAVNANETGSGPSALARISGDGRYIVFASAATDLVAGQTGPLTGGNIYLYDTTTGNITLVSHRSDSPAISANDFSSTQATTGFGTGAPAFNLVNDRYLIYDSYATDLFAGQTGPNHSNLYRYDVTTGTNVLISHSFLGSSASGDDDTFAADISQDGSSIAFSSLANDLVSGETLAAGHLANDLFLWTSSSGTAELLSGVYNPSTTKNSPTAAAGLGNFVVPAISADGLSVTFVSAATDLVVNQSASSTPATNNVFTFYTYSPLQKAFLDSSVEDSSGQPTLTEMSNGNAHALAVGGIPSSNNFTIAFIIDSTNILPNQGTNRGNVFLFQPFLGTRGVYTLVSSVAGSGGQQGAGGCLVDSESDLTDLSISDNGRFVSYQSEATDIVPGQASSALGPTLNVFLYDQNAAANALVSHVPGQPATGGDNLCNASRISADGSLLSFLSLSLNLVANATINSSGYDMYTYAVTSAGPASLATASAIQANATSLVYSTSADGRYSAFTSNSPNVVPNQIDFNRDQDVFLSARDPITGATKTTLVSHVPNSLFMTGNFGSPATNAGVVEPGSPVVISPDGNWIVFVSRATNLVPGQHTISAFVDAAYIDNVFLYDNRPGPIHGSIRLVSHVAGTAFDPAADSTEGELSSFDPVISSSSNGVFVAFASYAKALVPGLTGLQNDYFRANVFLYDVLHDTMNILSDNGTSSIVGNGDSRNPTISDNGQFIAFQSRATNLIPADTVFSTNNVYVVNQFIPGGNTTLVSHVTGNPNSSPDPGNSPGGPPTTASFRGCSKSLF